MITQAQPNLNCEPKLFDQEDYFKDTEFCSYSGLRVFSKCETLFRDMIIDKTYEEPDHTYFIYGKLVDAMVTESKEYLADNFILVERKVDIENALEIENKIKTLEAEMTTPDTKDKSMVQKAEAGNKVAIKGIEGRKKKIEEYQQQLEAIKNISNKTQITPAIWREAEETAAAIKAHPYFPSMEFNELTSQQVFTCEINGTKRKGKFDHLKLSPELSQLYGLYKVQMIDFAELQKQIQQLHPKDLWAIITDIKTFYSMEKIEPWNYRGQLKMYQDLLHHTLLIPIENITCQVLGADKPNGKIKMAEFFQFTQKALDEIAPDLEAWIRKWDYAVKNKAYVSDKAKNGMNQTCFTCSECRFCPLSQVPGKPVIVDGPRFKDKTDTELDLSEVIAE